MAKPTKYATPICIVLSIIALAGIVLGYYYQNPLIIAGFLLPVVAYEVYRTEGTSTKTSSIILLLLIIAEIIVVAKKIDFNVAKFLNTDQEGSYYYGYWLPFGEIKVLFPVITGIMSLTLLRNTNGIYTKWLSVLIIISAIAIIYLIDPNIFKELAERLKILRIYFIISFGLIQSSSSPRLST